VTSIAAAMEWLGKRQKPEAADAAAWSPEPVGLLVADPPTSTPLTDAQQIAKIGRQVMEEVRGYLSDRGIYSKSEGYSTYASKVMGTVNKTAGRSAGEVRTIEQAERRLTVIRQMRGRS
jgi:hypothetical protein